MPLSRRAILWSHSVLSLLLLAANVGAPFNSVNEGRVFLGSVTRTSQAQPVIRVRVVTSSGVSQGYRAVVGFAKAGPDEVKRHYLSRSSQLPPPADDAPAGSAGPAISIAWMNSPLRC